MPRRVPVARDDGAVFPSAMDAARAMWPGLDARKVHSKASAIAKAVKGPNHAAFGHEWHRGDESFFTSGQYEARIGALEAALRVTRGRLRKANEALRRAGLGEL